MSGDAAGQPVLADAEVDRLARLLDDATRQRREVDALTDEVALSVPDAYRIQALGVAARRRRGEQVVGAKAGLTSIAKQQQMGVSEPIFGMLTDAMSVDAAVPFDAASRIHPRVEPEVVFVLGDELAGRDVDSADVLAATAEIRGGLEIIDSRYSAFRFTLPDVIADNTSASGFVLGAASIAAVEVPLAELRCVLEINGVEHSAATGAALLSDPARCVAELVRHLSSDGHTLAAGSIVLAGGMTDAVVAAPGSTITARYPDLDDAVTLTIR